VKLRDNDEWVDEQFGSCQLGNALRTKRLQKVAANMLARPEKSLPQQNTQWADLKAAYRLFDNEQVTFDAVAEQHWQQTRRTSPGRYLLISDTTDIDHFSHRATTGLGQLGKGDGRGMQLHSCLVYNCDRKQIEGTAGALIHYRPKVCKEKKETRMQRLGRARESELWGNLVEKVGAAPEGCQWIHVFDRGGDNFEAMCHIHLIGCDWVIRAAKLNRNVVDESAETVPLRDALAKARVLGSYQLQLRSRPGVAARTADIEVSTVRVTFPRPRHRSPWVKQCGIDKLTMNVVQVQEVNAPVGVTPIRWVLLTSLATQTFAEAWQVIEDYENRWLIEEYHKVLKTGCSLELHALRTADRLEPLIALISVVGIRLFQLKLIGRSQPDAKASTHVPSSWLKCLKLVRPNLKLTALSVYGFFRELAKLGGFLGRKHDGEPGWQTVWRGYQRLTALLDGMRLAGAI
jgi:Transposase DNA-binding/Transposase Tn5 dimerisation domain